MYIISNLLYMVYSTVNQWARVVDEQMVNKVQPNSYTMRASYLIVLIIIINQLVGENILNNVSFHQFWTWKLTPFATSSLSLLDSK